MHRLTLVAALFLIAPAAAKPKNYCTAGPTSSAMIKLEAMVRRSGSADVLNDNFAKGLALGSHDIPIVVFGVKRGDVMYIVGVPKDAAQSCFFFAARNSPERRRVWSTDKAGALKHTIRVVPTRTSRAANTKFAHEFAKVKSFFLDLAAKQ